MFLKYIGIKNIYLQTSFPRAMVLTSHKRDTLTLYIQTHTQHTSKTSKQRRMVFGDTNKTKRICSRAKQKVEGRVHD